jgi:succinoglycan biosynthesis transport protein ExoP
MDSGNSLDSEYAKASSEGFAISIKDILAALRQGWWCPVFGCLIGLMLGTAYIVFVPTPYRSTARILLDTSVSRYLQTNKIVDEPIFDEAGIGSQIYILSSESILVPVIRSMNLAHDPEFAGPPKDAQNLGYINKLKKIAKQSIGWNGDADSTIDPDAVLERTAVEALLKNLTVFRGDIANVIDVTFTSQDPNKAAKIANAVADTYIAADLETRLKSTKTVSQWLQNRLLELKAQTLDADRALQNYKIANNLLGTGKNLLSSEQLSELNTQLTNARVAVAETKARFDGAHQVSEGIMDPKISAAAAMQRQEIPEAAVKSGAKTALGTFAANNTDIVKLRSEYRDLAARVAELEPDLGPRHVAVIKLHKKMDELRRTIRDQEQLIADSYANEYQLAKARESELAATVAQVTGEAGTDSQAQVKMRELESSADTLRTLYNSFLQKYNEMSTTQTETLSLQNARIINRATPPLHKISKKTAVVLAGSVMFGLFLGAGVVVAREWAADVFRTPKAVEQATGIQCVILPTVKENGGEGGTKSTMIEEFVLDARMRARQLSQPIWQPS